MWDALVAATHRLNLDSAVPLMVQGSFANAGGMSVGRAGVAVEFWRQTEERQRVARMALPSSFSIKLFSRPPADPERNADRETTGFCCKSHKARAIVHCKNVNCVLIETLYFVCIQMS